MKKNKMMRLASVLLVAVILTTCAISGTFAKYVTSDSATDTARVAKFGVTVSATGGLYGKNYVAEANGNIPGAANLTVESSDDDKLVAPGTKSADTGLAFSVAGTPEVKVNVAIAVSGVSDVFLAQKDALPDMTTAKDSDTFDNAEDYYPVKYTLTQTKSGSAPNKLVDEGTLAAVQGALTGLAHDFDANTNLGAEIGDLKLTWAWDFDDNTLGTYDQQDTLLGDLAAGTTLFPTTTLNPGTDYNLTSSITISITVTQVD